MEIKNNLLVFSFLKRYWQLVILTVVLNLLCLNDAIFEALGSLLYVPAVSAISLMVTYLSRHLIFRETIDKDASSGLYTAEWRALAPEVRIKYTIWITIGIFIGISIIAAGVST